MAGPLQRLSPDAEAWPFECTEIAQRSSARGLVTLNAKDS